MIIPIISGINDYERFPSATLQGCVPDALHWQALLESHNIYSKPLINSEATELAIKTALEDARDILTTEYGRLEGQRYSHIILYIQSSHGTDYVDASGITHQALCCYDFSGDDGRIEDVWLAAYAKSLPDYVLFIVISDACHSGDLLRELIQARYLPFPDVSRRPDRSIDQTLYDDGDRVGILLAGCHKEQTSADAFIDGEHQGAFSYFLIDALKKSWNLSYSRLALAASQGLQDARYSQAPTCEGEPSDTERIWLQVG